MAARIIKFKLDKVGVIKVDNLRQVRVLICR